MAASVPIPTETWTGKIREITLGALPAEGGTRGTHRDRRRRDDPALPAL